MVWSFLGVIFPYKIKQTHNASLVLFDPQKTVFAATTADLVWGITLIYPPKRPLGGEGAWPLVMTDQDDMFRCLFYPPEV